MSGKQHIMAYVDAPIIEQPVNVNIKPNIKGYVTFVFSFDDDSVYSTVNNFISSIMQQTVHYNSNKPYTGAARYNLENVIKTDYLPDIATKKQKSIGE